MKFRTELSLEKSSIDIDYQSTILCIGSCFAENIGAILSQHKFDTLINPMGIAYNPYSVSKHLSLLDQEINITDLRNADGRNFHFDFHGKFNNPDADEMLSTLAEAKKTYRDFLTKTDYVFISLGTAFVFKEADHGIVNNCHKLPNKQFGRTILSYDRIKSILLQIQSQIKALSPTAQVIYTVSPIRHIRDGLVQDRRSKSMLHAAIHDILKEGSISYFPSYELLVDDLRDYRFYNSDHIHPSTEAIQYIWDAFKTTYCTDPTITLLKKVQKISSAIQHRPINPTSNAHQNFLASLLKEIESISALDFRQEKEIIRSQMIA